MTCPKCGSVNTIVWGRRRMCMACETTFDKGASVTVACEVCKRVDTGQRSVLSGDGWVWYSSIPRGDYAICPQCEKVRAEQAEVERSKEKEHQPRGFTWGS